jgi:multidrug resistance efflux pump
MPAAYEIDLRNCGPLRLAIEARPPRWLDGTFAAITALVLAALAWSWLCRIELVVEAPGRLRPTSRPVGVAPLVDPGRSIGGTGSRVAAVHVQAGERVEAGQALAQLDTRALELEIADLEARIAGKSAELALVHALGHQQHAHHEAEQERIDAEIAQAGRQNHRDERTRRIDLSHTSVALERMRQREREADRLVADGHMKREELDDIRRDRRQLEADARKFSLGHASSVEVLRRSQVVLERAHEVTLLDLRVRASVLESELAAARGELARRELAMAETTLRAPIAGVVTENNLEVGALLDPTSVAFVVAPCDGFLFEAVVGSGDAGHVAVGMPARIAIDTFDAQRYGMVEGTVAYVSADSTDHEDAGLRYLVRVEVPTTTIGQGDNSGELRLGLSGRLEVMVGHERVLLLLLADLRDRFELEWSP